MTKSKTVKVTEKPYFVYWVKSGILHFRTIFGTTGSNPIGDSSEEATLNKIIKSLGLKDCTVERI